jgi:hypothetical protein
VFSAIINAAGKRYKVINMSLGGTIDRSNSSDNASWLAWDRVTKYANKLGTSVVVAAGNAAEMSNGTLSHLPSDLPNAISVSATGTSQLVASGGLYYALPGSDVLAFYSNIGAAKDVAAPGGDCGPGYPATCSAPYLILSTGISTTAGTANYVFMAGTSMAARLSRPPLTISAGGRRSATGWSTPTRQAGRTAGYDPGPAGCGSWVPSTQDPLFS